MTFLVITYSKIGGGVIFAAEVWGLAIENNGWEFLIGETEHAFTKPFTFENAPLAWDGL